MSTPVRALLTGQPCLAACAALAKPSSSRPSTDPRTVSAIPVSRKPPATVGLCVRRIRAPTPTLASQRAWLGANGSWCALIHDDVMDRSPLRRGQPAVHHRLAGVHGAAGWHGSAAEFGTAAAILAGDLCLV
jgi:hypothetical protein